MFRNLAGPHDQTDSVVRELTMARIEVVDVPDPEEATQRAVRSFKMGQLGPYKFIRAWAYYIVTGPVPIEIARELYADPLGKEHVRVCGHCGCPPPDEWARETDSGMVVYGYHIDSLAGLRLFADTVRTRS